MALTSAWLGDGTRLLVDAVAGLPDDGLRGRSRLPGWSRAHVVAHLARNAEALGRLAAWARTGVETPMYPDPATREADIERTAQQPPAALRRDLSASAADLDQALAGLDEPAWQATVRAGAAGREVRATVLPWLRVREVWLHRVDLDEPGTDGAAVLGAAPPALLDELLADVTGTLSADPACPRLLLEADDRDVVVPLGPDGPARADHAAADHAAADHAAATARADQVDAADRVDPTVVRGSTVGLLLWLTGRSDGRGLVRAGALPPLPRWL
ncbi:maleylpyruvate isomerase N-terminal domain-containing protein [Aquipuribacter sp. MA13-6]|uniref:maleylpyruvate isomerase N-terminal domain-containing protein n=1 Tax=unclassified Aquipuribacter TaxID=2635084 RepID=UPI003EE8BD6F